MRRLFVVKFYLDTEVVNEIYFLCYELESVIRETEDYRRQGEWKEQEKTVSKAVFHNLIEGDYDTIVIENYNYTQINDL